MLINLEVSIYILFLLLFISDALRQFSYVFSAYGNARKILDTSIPTTHLSSLHGIKFLSISWVMLGHVYYCKDYLTLGNV